MNWIIDKYKANSKYYNLFILFIILFILPFILGRFSIYNLNMIAIYAIVAVGLDILLGFTGQVSLCHAGFFAIGGYSYIILTNTFHLNFFINLLSSGLITCLSGLIVGIPALRLIGIYLAIATMGFGFIVEQVLIVWHGLTGGANGISVGPLSIFSFSIDSDQKYYFVILFIMISMFVLARNIIQSNTGRSFKALMDSEVSASTSGINVAKYKIIAFAISSFYAGIGGALYGQYQSFISPENFNIMLSIDFIVMIVIGGMGTVYGAIIGTAFVRFLPEILQTVKTLFPEFLKDEVVFLFYSVIYGLIMLLFLLYIPSGVYGSVKDFYKRMVSYNTCEGER